jgi:hypothetical protein
MFYVYFYGLICSEIGDFTNNFESFISDVIGFLTGVGCEREITNQNGVTSKLNVIELEADG